MRFLSLILFITLGFNVYAQQNSSQWRFPKNAIELCKNLENSIITAYKTEIEANRATINNQLSDSERNDASALSDAAKKFQRLNEDSWYKLNCAYILYRK